MTEASFGLCWLKIAKMFTTLTILNFAILRTWSVCVFFNNTKLFKLSPFKDISPWLMNGMLLFPCILYYTEPSFYNLISIFLYFICFSYCFITFTLYLINLKNCNKSWKHTFIFKPFPMTNTLTQQNFRRQRVIGHTISGFRPSLRGNHDRILKPTHCIASTVGSRE